MLERVRMANYLKDKYGKEFVVTNLRAEGSGLGVPGQNTADAYLVGAKGLTFEVGRYSNGEYYDTYVVSLWSREAFADAVQIVQSSFGSELPWLKVEVYPVDKMTGRKDKTSRLYSKLPSLEAQMKQDKSVVAYDVHVRTAGTFDEKDKAQHVERLKKLVEFVANMQTGVGAVRYVVNLDNENAMYVCNISGEPLRYDGEGSELGECFQKYNEREG